MEPMFPTLGLPHEIDPLISTSREKKLYRHIMEPPNEIQLDRCYSHVVVDADPGSLLDPHRRFFGRVYWYTPVQQDEQCADQARSEG